MLRSLICLMLTLMLALTSQSMAVARGASAATDQMVLCTGTGPVAVYMDADGQPTSAPHICPDSALNIIVLGPVQHTPAPARPVKFAFPVALADRLVPALPRRTPPSRAPPVIV